MKNVRRFSDANRQPMNYVLRYNEKHIVFVGWLIADTPVVSSEETTDVSFRQRAQVSSAQNRSPHHFCGVLLPVARTLMSCCGNSSLSCKAALSASATRRYPNLARPSNWRTNRSWGTLCVAITIFMRHPQSPRDAEYKNQAPRMGVPDTLRL